VSVSWMRRPDTVLGMIQRVERRTLPCLAVMNGLKPRLVDSEGAGVVAVGCLQFADRG
jgi:hypothetical protein